MNDCYDEDNQKIRLSDWRLKEFEDAWGLEGKNYIDVIAEKKDLTNDDKIFLLYIAQKNFKTQIHQFASVLIDQIFEPNNDLESNEKLLWIMLFNIVDQGWEVTTSRKHLQGITSMDKIRLNSTVDALIAKDYLSKEGSRYTLKISEFIKKLAKQHNISI
jgi:hypothetical protein